jgi:hypothetical protein
MLGVLGIIDFYRPKYQNVIIVSGTYNNTLEVLENNLIPHLLKPVLHTHFSPYSFFPQEK